MAQLRIPYVDRRFPVTLELSKFGEKNSISVPAIIDTGATDTVISFSHVNSLGISPEINFTGTNTASGQMLSRHYPVRIGIDKAIYRLGRAMVLFKPEAFMQAAAIDSANLDILAISDFCAKNGLTQPEAILTNSVKRPDGKFDLTLYRPGLGVEQPQVLVGMDILSGYDWAFSKSNKELVIEY